MSHEDEFDTNYPEWLADACKFLTEEQMRSIKSRHPNSLYKSVFEWYLWHLRIHAMYDLDASIKSASLSELNRIKSS